MTVAGTGMTELDQLVRAAADAMRRRDPSAARPLFERVVAGRPNDIGACIGLAFACRDLGDGPGQLAALDQVLAANPSHLPALLMKADHFAEMGDGRAAQTFYRAAVERAPARNTLSPELRGEILRAERMSAQYGRTYESHLLETLSTAGFDPDTSSRRFAQSVDLLLGKKRIYFQSPTSFYFPELPQRQFYERGEFPWLAALEANTDVIREELRSLLGEAHAFTPYVRGDGSRPPKDFGRLMNNPDWGAFYLIENGAVNTEAAARCPATMEALREVPLSDAPGRTPSVLFSLLQPGLRIPAHNGYTNVRLICHLPLIVPPGCGLRVGNEVRHWVESQTLIFDDSIEHEAWNESSQPRVVLLFDIWRPELTKEEKALVAATLSAVGSYRAD